MIKCRAITKHFCKVCFVFLFSCAEHDSKQNIDQGLTIIDTLHVPVVGANTYVGYDAGQQQLLIRNDNGGLFLYDLAKEDIVWQIQPSSLMYLDDPVLTVGMVEDKVLVMGYKFMQTFDARDGSKLRTQRLPNRLSKEFDNPPLYSVRINGAPYFLTTYVPTSSVNAEMDALSPSRQDYLGIRHFTLFPMTEEDSLHTFPIGRIEKDANILSEDDKIPFVGTVYTVAEDTLYYAFKGEPKVWQIPISKEDPPAIRSFDLALRYPENRYLIPKEKGNNLHDFSFRIDNNMTINQFLFDEERNLFYLVYMRALFQHEKEEYENQEEWKSQLELGYNRFNLVILDRSFNSVAEITLPVHVHTVVGAGSGELFFKGFDEGEDYDIIYKASLEDIIP